MAEPISPDSMQQLVAADVPQEDSLVSPEAVSALFDDGSSIGEVRRDSLTSQIVSAQGKALDPTAINIADASVDHRQALEAAAHEVYNQLEGALADAASQAVSLPGGDVTNVAAQLKEGQELINNSRGGPLAVELAIIQNAAKVPLADVVRQEVAVSLALTNELSRMMDDMGLMDKAKGFGALLIPLRGSRAWLDMKAGIESNDVLSLYMTGDSISGMISSWQSLPVARKEVLLPLLIRTIVESIRTPLFGKLGGPKMDPNTLIAVSSLIRFFQSEGATRAVQEQRIGLALDVLDIGGSALGALADVAKLSKLGKGTGIPSGTVGGPRRPSPEGFGFERRGPREGETFEGEVVSSTFNDVAKLPQVVRQEMELIMFDVANKSLRENSLAKVAAKVGDTAQAARINLAAMDSPDIARAFGISTDDAIINAMPFQTKEWLPGAIDGLVPETAAAINEGLRAAERGVRSMTNESDLFRVGALNKSDRQHVVLNFLDEMDRIGEDMMMEGITMSKVNVTKESADGFEFEYTITRITDGIPEQVTGRRSWRVNQVTGNYDDTVVDLAATTTSSLPGQSPTAWSVTKPGDLLDFNDAAKVAIQLEDIAVASKQRINELWIDANTTIGGPHQMKARQRVNDIELAGDEYANPDSHEKGRVFSHGELTAGVQTRNGTVHLTSPDEVVAYYKRRIVADSFHAMQNFVTRRELELGGFKSTFVSPAGEDLALLVKPFDEVAGAQASASSKVGFEAWDTATKTTTVMTPEFINRVYADGKILARLREDWNVSGNGNMRGGRHVEYIVMDRASIEQLPQQVVNYKYGYVPKINEGIEFVVQQLFPYKKAGAQGLNKKEALRAFASRQDANKFINIMATKYAAKYGISLEDAMLRFDIGDGSAMGQMERMENALSGTNGLFTGTRAADDLLMGLDGVAIERMNPAEAYGRYIDHLGTKVAKNEWRIGRETDWLNTVRRQSPETKVIGFNGTILPDNDTGKALGRLRDQINKWNRVPSRKETLYEASIQGLHDWTLNGARGLGIEKNAISSILYFKHINPASAIMAASMHTMLGTLNPAQYYVQASAMVVALSLRPIAQVPNIIGRAIGFGTYDNMKGDGVVAKVMRLSRQSTDAEVRAAGNSMEEYRLWERSGLRESVRSNADMNYMSNTGLGLTADVMRKASTTSLFIYRAGELLNRRVSFIAAYDTIKNKRILEAGLSKNLSLQSAGLRADDDFLGEVLELANLTMLELNAANKAWFQGGPGASGFQMTVAMTTQFLQVLTKTTELGLKGPRRGGFNLQQKKRIGIGQWAAFGAAGVPLLSMFGPAMVDWVSEKMGLDDSNPDDLQLKISLANAFNQSFVGVLSRDVFGADIDVAGRAALASGILTTIEDIITSKDPMWIKVLGVSSETGRRLGEVAQQVVPLVKSHALAALAELEPFSMADRRGMPQLTASTMVAAATDIVVLLRDTIPSSGRSLLKERMMDNHGIIMDRRGRITVRAKFNLATRIGVALGFQTTRETRLRAVTLTNKDNTELVREASDVIVAAYHRLAYVHNNHPDHAASVHILTQYVQEALNNDELVDELRRSLKARLFSNPKTTEEKELLTFFERTASGKITQGLILDSENAINFSNVIGQQAVVIPFADTIKREGE